MRYELEKWGMKLEALHCLDDLVCGGQAPRLLRGEHFAAVNDHVERAGATELDPGIDAKRLA